MHHILKVHFSKCTYCRPCGWRPYISGVIVIVVWCHIFIVSPGHRTLYIGVHVPLGRKSHRRHRHHGGHNKNSRKRSKERESGVDGDGRESPSHSKSMGGVCCKEGSLWKCDQTTLFEKRVPKGFFSCPHRKTLFWLHVKPFLVPCRTILGSMQNPLWKGFFVEPKRVLRGTKRVFIWNQKKVIKKVTLWGQPNKPFRF